VAAEVGRAGRIAARDAASGGGPAGRSADGAGHGPDGGAGRGEPEHDRRDEAPVMPHPDLRDPVVLAERQLLQAVLQFPGQFDATELDAIDPAAFTAPAHRAVHDAMRAAGGPGAAATTGVWADRVTEAAAATVRPLVSELAVAPLPTRIDGATGLPERRYLSSLLVRVQEVALTRRIADALSALRCMESGDPEAARALSVQLQGLQRELVALRDRLG